MSNSIAKIANITSSLRVKVPGIAEFKALLNLIEEPAVLVDTSRFQIILGNSQFYLLTAYPQNEIAGTTLETLLPSVDMIQLLTGVPQDASLIRHNRSPQKVIIHLLPLEDSTQWSLLMIRSLEASNHSGALSQRQKDLFKSFLALSQLVDQPDLDSALYAALDIGLSMVCTDILSVYSADSHFPKLKKIKTSGENTNPVLPDEFSSVDLIRLTSPNLWVPGKRVSTDLHRAARIGDLSCIATTPLGPQGAWLGLLVAANRHTPPDDDLLELLEVLAGHITSTMLHYISLLNTRATIKRINQVLPVQKSIIDNTQEGIIILQRDHTILDINPATELMLGYSSTEVTGKTIDDVLIGTESLTSALKSAKNGIPTHNLGNLSLHHRDGHSFPAQIQTIPVLVDGDVNEIVIILCDHSENEQVRVRTQQLEQRALLGEVTSIFAHEVRNPINNISVGLQVLADNLAENPVQLDLVNRALNDCSRLTALMNSVLQFSKATEYKMEAIDIKVLIQRLLERWRPRFANASIQSYIQSSIKSPKVTGDARTLEQVFTNLISNSVNAMRDKGGILAIKIDPQTEPEDPPQMLITVTDNGPGIPEDIRDHIFEPFVTSKSQQGTGLGLAITRGIVNAHHGSIHVDSFPGGTIFTIKLPIAPEED